MELLIGLITGVLLGAGIILVIYQLVWVGPMASRYDQLKQETTRQLHDLRARLRLLSRRYAEEQRRLAAAHQENVTLRTRLEHTTHLVAQLQTASVDNQHLQTELAEARQVISQLQARLDGACHRLHDEQQRHKMAASQNERLYGTLVALAGKAGRWAALAAERQAQMERLAAAQAENETLHQQLSRLETALTEMPGKMAQSVRPGFAAAVSPLQQIRGIGPVYARRLQEAGIHTLADFLGRTPEQLRQITGTSQRQGGPDIWLAEAEKLAKSAG